MMAKIAPSFLAADIWRVAEQIESLEATGCEYLHLDVMDGRFVPNISFGPPYIKSLRPHSQMIFDTHLMVDEPDRFFADFKAAGADMLTVHLEACRHLHRSIQAIKGLGLKAGVALNPATPLHQLSEILSEVDLVLLMSVNPGFGGQKFIAQSLDKLHNLAALRQEQGLNFLIEVDGGITEGNAAEIAAAGADLLVAGSSVFGRDDVAGAYRGLVTQIKPI